MQRTRHTRATEPFKLGPKPHNTGQTKFSKYQYRAQAYSHYDQIPLVIREIRNPKNFKKRLKRWITNHDDLPTVKKYLDHDIPPTGSNILPVQPAQSPIPSHTTPHHSHKTTDPDIQPSGRTDPLAQFPTQTPPPPPTNTTTTHTKPLNRASHVYTKPLHKHTQSTQYSHLIQTPPPHPPGHPMQRNSALWKNNGQQGHTQYLRIWCSTTTIKMDIIIAWVSSTQCFFL